MPFQKLVLQNLSNEEPTGLQSSEHLWQVAEQPHSVRTFQNAQRSREREIPAEGYRPANLLVDKKNVYPKRFREQNGFSFTSVQCDWKLGRLSFLGRANLKPGGERRQAVAHVLRRFRIAQFFVHRNRDKNLLKQLSEQMFLSDGDQVPEWCCVVLETAFIPRVC